MDDPIQLQWLCYAPGMWWAEHPLGSYYVDLYGWRPSNDAWVACQPVDVAKAAAQADFNRRVRACFARPEPAARG